MGEVRKLMSCKNATATPALMAQPWEASSAAAMNTPTCARKPAPPASMYTRSSVLRRAYFASSSEPETSSNIRFTLASALKLLITEKPAKLSFTAST